MEEGAGRKRVGKEDGYWVACKSAAAGKEKSVPTASLLVGEAAICVQQLSFPYFWLFALPNFSPGDCSQDGGQRDDRAHACH